MIFFASVPLLLLAGLLYQAFGARRDRRLFPPPGRLVESQGVTLHLHDRGEGAPAVILEAGIAASSVGWHPVQEAVSRFTRVCSYDRASLGWSGPAARERTLDRIVGELRELLRKGRIEPPYVLVGHSFGGLIMRAYARRYPQEVGGLLLVDPIAASDWFPLVPARKAMLERGVRLSRRGAWLARVGIVRLALALLSAGSRRIPKLLAKVSSGNGAPVVERLTGEVRKLPPELWPVVRAHWSDPKCFRGMAAYLEAMPSNVESMMGCPLPSDIPVTVISAGSVSVAVQREHAEIAACSTKGQHVIARDTGHWVQLDSPDLVIAAIEELVNRLR